MKIDFYHVDTFELANYESVWKALLEKGVDAALVAVPGNRNTANKDWFDFENFQNLCKARGIPFLSCPRPDADAGITTQNADILSDYSRRIRLMYGPVVFPEAWALQPHAVQPFDAVLTHGKAYTEHFSQWLPISQLPIIGYPRYDAFFSGKLNKRNLRTRWLSAEKKPILTFLPTWGNNTAIDEFLPWLIQLKNHFHLLCRPHHCTARFEPERMQAFKQAGMTILTNPFDLPEIYAVSDVVVADVRSGGLFEAIICGIPAVGMMSTTGNDAEWLQSAGIHHTASLCSRPEQLAAAIQQALSSDTQKAAQHQWAESHVSFRDGSAAARAADAIVKICTKKKFLNPLPAPDPFDAEQFLTPVSLPQKEPAIPKKPRILFLLGSAAISGGTYVILQHALYLSEHGFDVTIGLVFMTENELSKLRQSEDCWHPAIKCLRFVEPKKWQSEQYNTAIFTWWATLFSLKNIHAERFVYFVQSIESRFYLENRTFIRALADRTYQLGLPVITEAAWIEDYLRSQYNCDVFSAKNGILKNIYSEKGPVVAARNHSELRILVEGPLDIAFKNVPRTIELCRESGVGEVWLLTSSEASSWPGADRVFSRIPIHKVPEVYRACDILVKLSSVEGMFGPPLEMFHCGGTAIVYDVTGVDEYIRHEVNALVIPMGDEKAVVNALRLLRHDPVLLQRLKKNAGETAATWPDWNTASTQFATAVEKITSIIPPHSQKNSMYPLWDKMLQEHLTVQVTQNQIVSETIVTAKPLHDSGHYELLLPLVSGNNIFKIFAAEKYSHFFVTNIMSQDTAGFQISAKITTDNISVQADKSFLSESPKGNITVSVTLQGTNRVPENPGMLSVRFFPQSLQCADTKMSARVACEQQYS